MKTSLYQISSEMQELLTEITNSEGELTPELESKINYLDQVLKDKAHSICEYRQSLMDYETLLEEKIEHLKTMRSQIHNKVDKLEDYVLNSMKRMDINKIESDLWSVSIRKPLKKVEIYDDKMIPIDLIKQKIETSIDKAAIAKKLKAGEEVQGARLVDGVESLNFNWGKK